MCLTTTKVPQTHKNERIQKRIKWWIKPPKTKKSREKHTQQQKSAEWKKQKSDWAGERASVRTSKRMNTNDCMTCIVKAFLVFSPLTLSPLPLAIVHIIIIIYTYTRRSSSRIVSVCIVCTIHTYKWLWPIARTRRASCICICCNEVHHRGINSIRYTSYSSISWLLLMMWLLLLLLLLLPVSVFTVATAHCFILAHTSRVCCVFVFCCCCCFFFLIVVSWIYYVCNFLQYVSRVCLFVCFGVRIENWALNVSYLVSQLAIACLLTLYRRVKPTRLSPAILWSSHSHVL